MWSLLTGKYLYDRCTPDSTVLTTTNRLMALSGGPLEGTYFFQPRQMRVNKPLNINDDDLLGDKLPIERPLSEPTAMSYYIQRIKLAEICRSVVDTIPLAICDFSNIDYQDVINLDRKFETFFQDLPDFFKVDDAHIRASEPIMRHRPHLQIQRYALSMIALTRRCKLHQPFLIRGSQRHHYDYSRRISLESARDVIRTRDLILISEHDNFVAVSAKHTGIVFHIFVATIVLVMDLCFNKAAVGENDVERKAEVASACRLLEDSKSQSAMASEFLESLMDVLRKHKVRLYHQNPPGENNAGVAVAQDKEGQDIPFHFQHQQQHQQLQTDLPMTYEGAMLNWTMNSPSQSRYETALPTLNNEKRQQPQKSEFDSIWQEYVEFGPNMDNAGWDSLFSDLDSRF